MSQLTLRRIPGYIDIPDSQFAAESFASGLNFQRLMANSEFGIVRPEVFVKTYTHGQTVDLPVSPVDGYTYQRDELIYLWHCQWSGSTNADQKPSGPGTIWYYQMYVDQATGEVSSWIKYRESEDVKKRAMTNDGWVNVITIGMRRKSGMIVNSPRPLPQFYDVSDAELAVDKAFSESMAYRFNRNSKFAALRNEVIYMGEFTNGQTVPAPVSPVDGYQYTRAEVKYQFAWRWTCQGASFGDPPYNQLQAFSASINAGTGAVSTSVVYYDDGETATTHGRLVVVAFCARGQSGGLLLEPGNQFSELTLEDFYSGKAPRTDLLQGLAANIRFAALRTEYFFTEQTHGTYVPLPVSPVDGYAYAREELTYCPEFATTRPNSYIRLFAIGIDINPTTGYVHTETQHMKEGGSWRPGNEGTAHVLTIATRSHVTPSVSDPALTTEGGGAEDPGETLRNGNFESWSGGAGQTIADDWKAGATLGATFSQDAGLEGQAAQGMAVTAGNYGSIVSRRLNIRQGDRRYISLRLKSSVAANPCFKYRIHMYNADLSNHSYFDAIPNTGFTGQVQNLNSWFEIPQKNAGNAKTMAGNAGLVGTYDFVCTYIKIELYIETPNVNVHVSLDSLTYGVQLDTAQGQVAQSGVAALAFFPAIPISVTDTEADIDLSGQILKVDGTVIETGQGTAHITGLTPSTQYGLYLFYNELTGQKESLTGGHGSNGWCFLSAEWTRERAVAWAAQNHITLSDGPIYFTTNAAGVGTPTGTYGGGDGGCHIRGTKVRERRRGVITVEKVMKGDFLWSKDDTWIEVTDVRRSTADEWVFFDFTNGVRNLGVTAGHVFETADGREVRAHDMTIRTELLCPTGRTAPRAIRYASFTCVRISISCVAPHLFYVSNDGINWVLDHNLRPLNTL